MKVITVHHPHAFKKEEFPPLVMALGYFDGIHLGHQKVIKTAKHIADDKQWNSAVMTFDPHPSVVLSHNKKQVKSITPIETKKKLIKEMGVDFLFIVRFTSNFASLSPRDFVDQYIVGLNVRHVVAGFDYTYGRFGKGTMDTLPTFANERFTHTTVEKLVNNDGEEDVKVSSTLTRQLLNEGDMVGVEKLLGRFYQTDGTVIHGEKRGRQIGFPTANVQVNGDYIIPKTGVYAVRLKVSGKWHNAVCNVGYKPTFKNPDEYSLSVEVHIFDFEESIYGEEVKIEWYIRLRDEKKFNGIDELKEQISLDKMNAINYFEKL